MEDITSKDVPEQKNAAAGSPANETVKLEYSWPSAASDMIRGLKRHLQTRVSKPLEEETIVMLQTTVRYFNPTASITDLWDFPASFWPNIDQLGEKVYMHEIAQCLNFLACGKVIPADSKLHEKMTEAICEWPDDVEYLHFRECFPGKALKEAAKDRDVPRLKLLSDLMGGKGKSFAGVYHILLNMHAYKTVMEAAALCGNFELVDMQTLALTVSQRNDTPADRDFKRFCMPYLAGIKNIFTLFQKYSQFEELLIPALEAGISDQLLIFPFGQPLPVWKYFRFLCEIEPELSWLKQSNCRLGHDLRAAKLYREWEKKNPRKCVGG